MAAVGCAERDPVLGAWRVNVEKTLAAVKDVPAARRAKFPTPAAWRKHLKGKLAGEELAFRPLKRRARRKGRFDGRVTGKRFHGTWKRVPQLEGRYKLYRWMSGETFLLDGIFEITEGAAAWRGRLFFPRKFTIYLDRR